MLSVLVLVAAVVSLPVPSAAEDPDVYAVLDLDALLDAYVLAEDGGPVFSAANGIPHVVLQGDGAAFVARARRDPRLDGADAEQVRELMANGGPFRVVSRVALRAPAGMGLRGTLQFDGERDDPGVLLPFEVPDHAFVSEAAEFHEIEHLHYQWLLDGDLPGAAWFRHQRDEAARALPEDDSATMTEAGVATDWRRQNRRTVEDSFELFTGGRAVSENLQLDRTLPATPEGEDTVPIASVEGVATRAYDWSTLVDGLDPELDPLAWHIPEDQHALFFPDFDALIAVADHAEQHGAPVLAALEPRTESAGTRTRYEHQLGIPMSALSRLLGPAVVRSVAITGADPYLRTGADVAMLFEGNATVLEPLLMARVLLAAQSAEGAGAVEGVLRGTEYAGVRTLDRALCSYVAPLGEQAVVVTNSLAQLDRLLATVEGERPALASLDEYVFFRDRYPRGDSEETALLILSDATIRRWCGPRWRIGSSRRSRAAASLAEWQARFADQLVGSVATPGPVTPDEDVPDVGTVTLTGSGVHSDVFGSLEFATPILEMDLERVTEAEQDLYLRWRRGYESNWAEFFDPIAIRCTVDDTQLAIDMTVRPLVVGSDYEDLVQMTSGASIGPLSGDPHPGVLLHWVSSFDKYAKSLSRNEMVGFARVLMPNMDPLGWMGSAYAIYADKDAFWVELAAAQPHEGDGLEEFWTRNLYRLPLALHADVGDPLQLTLFLAAARAFIEQSAPDMLAWETREHAGRSYVRVSPTQQALDDFQFMEVDDDWQPPALHYLASGQGFVMSLSEELIQRAIDRQLARLASREAESEAATDAASEPEASPWLGEQVAVRVDRDVATLVREGLINHSVQLLQKKAWDNLPILDEWKHRWPDRDPLVVHELLWGRRLLCPGGGSYEWSEQDRRMQSSLYGHPGRPLDGPVLPATAQQIGSGEFGLDFEEEGLRARVRLTREE